MFRLQTFLMILLLCVLSNRFTMEGQNVLPSFSQEIEVDVPKVNEQNVVTYTRPFAKVEPVTMNFDSKLKPFYHGVASGDPLDDRVILWTRVTPDTDRVIEVKWKIATDTLLRNVVLSGNTTTDESKDYTVKIDAIGLKAGTSYYYGFEALGRKSLTGRTRTAPAEGVNHLRFAVVSCSNYQQGFFNAYGRIAERKDLDAVIHLGDYIYEYAEGEYGYSKEVDRGHEPKKEAISLTDYRIRHSFYKLDPDLRRAHQQYPFIPIWDDHESANDSYKDGADNHDSTKEGSWSERKYSAEKAYFEWMPIRPQSNSSKIYRKISYGNLVDLLLLDTRLEGREKQLGTIDTAHQRIIDTIAWKSSSRTILGDEQRNWFFSNLQHSTAKWKIVANQVMMMQLNAQVLGFPTNLDAWDGYPAEREKFLDFIHDNEIKNIVVVTGDIHCTWVSDLTKNPYDTMKYNAKTGEGSGAVEFVTPSITSANVDELLGVKGRTPFIEQAEGIITMLNPHIKDLELVNHGYFILDITPEKAQADYYFVDSITVPTKKETFWKGFYSRDKLPTITRVSIPAASKENAPDFAPESVQEFTLVSKETEENETSNSLLVLGIYPNPLHTYMNIGYVLKSAQTVTVKIYGELGEEIHSALGTNQEPGTYSLLVNTRNIGNGKYYCRFITQTGSTTRTFVVNK